MCGRYYIEEDEDDLRFRAALDELNRKTLKENLKTSGEIFPSDTVPVLAPDREGRASAFAMTWGYTLGTKRVINARSESAASSPMFRDGLARRRCVVPASRYFEWRRDGKHRVKYAIGPARGALYMAGVYRLEGRTPVFAILTRPAAESVRFIHDRMPVILTPEFADQWIDISADPGFLVKGALDDMVARPLEDEQLTIGGPFTLGAPI